MTKSLIWLSQLKMASVSSERTWRDRRTLKASFSCSRFPNSAEIGHASQGVLKFILTFLPKPPLKGSFKLSAWFNMSALNPRTLRPTSSSAWLTITSENPCGYTALEMLEWKEIIEQIHWWPKQPPQWLNCVSEDLKCWGAWNTTCGRKTKDITPSIAWRREAWKGETLDYLPWKDERDRGRDTVNQQTGTLFFFFFIPDKLKIQ